MSITDTPRDLVDPHNIYIEVEAGRLRFPEGLVSSSQPFTQVLEDINTNDMSDYLITGSRSPNTDTMDPTHSD